MADNIQDLWQAYRSAKEPAIKEKLILEYAPLVKLVAGRISIHMLILMILSAMEYLVLLTLLINLIWTRALNLKLTPR